MQMAEAHSGNYEDEQEHRIELSTALELMFLRKTSASRF